MNKNELILYIFSSVANETGITKDQILSKIKTEEVVDARHMVVKFLSESGLYPSSIARIFNVTPRCISYILSAFDDRINTNRMMKFAYKRIEENITKSGE